MTALSLLPEGNPRDAPDLDDFVRRLKRLPRLGDDPPPWSYRGWLLPYVIQLHALIPAVRDRWGYHLRTLDAGRLLDEPIPQISFGPCDNSVFPLLREWSRLVNRDCGGWSDFCTLLEWLAWSLAVSRDVPRLADEVQEKLYRQVNVIPLLEHPYDYLGEYVASSKAQGWNRTGFFPTPHAVVECMVRMTMHDSIQDGRDPRTYRICDPCVGSGRMLLHASNHSLCLYGQDIDRVVLMMCQVNGALYAPWMSFPLPAAVLNSRTEPTALPAPAGGSQKRHVPARSKERRAALLPFDQA